MRKTKSEARNPKQIQMTKEKKIQNSRASGVRQRFCHLDFGPLNLFRISDFDIGIYGFRVSCDAGYR